MLQVLLKAVVASEPIVLCGNCFKTSNRELSQTGGSVCPSLDTGWETCNTYYNWRRKYAPILSCLATIILICWLNFGCVAVFCMCVILSRIRTKWLQWIKGFPTLYFFSRRNNLAQKLHYSYRLLCQTKYVRNYFKYNVSSSLKLFIVTNSRIFSALFVIVWLGIF